MSHSPFTIVASLGTCAAALVLVSCVAPPRAPGDYAEDRYDHVENRVDRRTYSGPGDHVENKVDRKEDRMDRRGAW